MGLLQATPINHTKLGEQYDRLRNGILKDFICQQHQTTWHEANAANDAFYRNVMVSGICYHKQSTVVVSRALFDRVVDERSRIQRHLKRLRPAMLLFLYGIATFLSPCSIALISVYVVYVAGLSGSIRRAAVIGCSFVAAMCLVFFVLGYAVSSLIPIDLASSRFFFGLSGVLLILFGLSNLRLLEKANLIRYAEESLAERANILKPAALKHTPKYNYVIGSFLFGTIISLALGPCSLSLVLPAILLSLFSAPTPLHGGCLLFMFGLGHSLPVVFLSVALATARREVNKRMIAAGNWVTKLFGPAFVGIGLIMIAYALGVW